jgi:hypothetical protein
MLKKEHRGGKERRSGLNRRISNDPNYKGPEHRSGRDRRSGKNRRKTVLKTGMC